MAGLRPQHALVVALLALGTPPALSAAVVYAPSHAASKANSQPLGATIHAQPPTSRRLARVAGVTQPLLRIPLLLNRSHSALTQPEIAAILAEVNCIWRQAGICFEVRDVRQGYGPRSELMLWFIAAEVPFVNGYYEDDQNIWTQDEPRLARAPRPARLPAARTAAHELGHALGLRHVPRTRGGLGALMNTGYDGYRLDAEEIRHARRAAIPHKLPVGSGPCRPPDL